MMKLPSGSLASVTRKVNDIKALLESEPNSSKEVLKNNYLELVQRIDKLKLECSSLIADSTTEDSQSVNEWLDSKLRDANELITNLKQMLAYSPSIGGSSIHTRNSAKSHVSSIRAQIAVRKAKLVADEAIYAQQEAIRAQQDAIRSQLERLSVERERIELQTLEQEIDAIQESEIAPKGGLEPSCVLPISSAAVHLEPGNLDQPKISTRPLGYMRTAGEKFESDNKDRPPYPKYSREAEIKNYVDSFENNPKQSYFRFPKQEIDHEQSLKCAIEATAKAVSAAYCSRASVPKMVVSTFDGTDLTRYNTFIAEFERVIERTCTDDTEKYQQLLQCTSGFANFLVRSHEQRDGSLAFNGAKKELQDQFGDAYAIAQSFILKLREWPPIKADRPSDLKALSIYLLSCQNIMGSVSSLNQLNSPEEIMKIVKKLPYDLQKTFRSYSYSKQESTGEFLFSDLVSFIKRQARILNNPIFSSIGSDKKADERQVKSKRTLITNVSNNWNHAEASREEAVSNSVVTEEKTCHFCKGRHVLDECPGFNREESWAKIRFIKRNRICFGCLSSKRHITAHCPNRITCLHCKKSHPTSLHRGKPPDKNVPPPKDENSSTNSISARALVADSVETRSAKLLHSVLPICVWLGEETPIRVYASLDTCSTDCWMSYSLMKTLGARNCRQSLLNVTTMEGNNNPSSVHVITNVSISDCYGNNVTKLPIVYSKNSNWPFTDKDSPKREEIESLDRIIRDVPFNFIDSNIEILIGMNHPDLVRYFEIVESSASDVYATHHILGWALNGKLDLAAGHSKQCLRTEVSLNLDDKIKAFFEHDFRDLANDDSVSPSVEDQLWLDRVSSSLTHNNGHYEIALPFRSYPAIMPNNKFQAYNRFKGTKRRLIKNEEYCKEYQSFMKSMIDKEFVERVPCEQLNQLDGKKWYLVHHSVYHKRKNKLRVVFDCSLKYRNTSLNDQLLPGPDLINNLVGVLLRFRQYDFALMADIEKMFYMVNVKQEHRNFLRFFWFPGNDINEEPVEYRMKVHLFGACSSPSIAGYALRKTADDFSSADSLANRAIKRNMYVDDLLISFDDEEIAKQAAYEIRNVLLKGGFNIVGFISNSKSILKSLDKNILSHNVSPVDLFGERLPNDHALGVLWDTELDSFGFKVSFPLPQDTRRGVLAATYSIFDPLGLVGPAILPAKLVFQKTFDSTINLNWDDPLPDKLRSEWHNWLREVSSLKMYKVPRSFKPLGSVKCSELHIFSDGSEVAYCSAAYARYISTNDSITCRLIMAKNRLVPRSHKFHPTIPKIELQAARLSASLYRILQHELDISFNEVYFWCDSTIVLQYITNESRRFSRYVANRVSYIRSCTLPSSWRYVNSSQNPADIGSRGILPGNFVRNETWIQGPAFLKNPDANWPSMPNIVLDDSEENLDNIMNVRTTTCGTTSLRERDGNSCLDRLFESVSNWYKLKRKVAWILRIKKSLAKKEKFGPLSLTVCELDEAENAILRVVQGKYYSEVFQLLKRGQIPSTHRLRRLAPFIDNSDGLLRVGGRLKYARNITYAKKHPILIPNCSIIAELIVRFFHVYRCGHMGLDSVRSALRENYWIEADGALIRRVCKNCVVCRKSKGMPSNPFMANLPADRIESTKPPFYSTGTDIFGPFLVKSGRRSIKCYGVIFSCMASRAVHIECAESLSTDSFICALRRFICRRGSVKIIRCDNGKNLVGAAKELSMALKELDQERISRRLQEHQIQWKFRPPYASHFGGSWERQIRTVRQVLNSLLHEQPSKLTLEGIYTLFCEVEFVLNNIPLTPVYSDMESFEAITPNHLLMCNTEIILPPGNFDKSDSYSRKRWRHIQYLSDLFWTRWRKSYLSLLQQRQKWTRQTRSLVKGDLVLVTDLNLPRNLWPLGRVVETIEGKDGIVRSVKVLIARDKDPKKSFASHVLERPSSKIVLLIPHETD